MFFYLLFTLLTSYCIYVFYFYIINPPYQQVHSHQHSKQALVNRISSTQDQPRIAAPYFHSPLPAKLEQLMCLSLPISSLPTHSSPTLAGFHPSPPPPSLVRSSLTFPICRSTRHAFLNRTADSVPLTTPPRSGNTLLLKYPMMHDANFCCLSAPPPVSFASSHSCFSQT